MDSLPSCMGEQTETLSLASLATGQFIHGEGIWLSVDPYEDERESGAATPLAGMYRSSSPEPWLQSHPSPGGDEVTSSTPSTSADSSPPIGEIAQLAWNLYLQCEESSRFQALSKELGSLHSVLSDLGEHLEERRQENDLPEHQMARFTTLLETCKYSLDELHALLRHSDDLSMTAQRTRGKMRSGLEGSGISEIRRKLISSVTLLASFQSTFLNSSTARIERRLNDIIPQYRGRASGSTTSRSDSGLWTGFFSELEDMGISREVLGERQDLIVSLLQQAVTDSNSPQRSSNRSLTPIADDPDEAPLYAGGGSRCPTPTNNRNPESRWQHRVESWPGGSSERVDDEVNGTQRRRLLTCPSVQSFATSSSKTLGNSSSASSIYSASASTLDLPSSKKHRPKKRIMRLVKKLFHKQTEIVQAASDEGDVERVSRLVDKGMDVNAVGRLLHKLGELNVEADGNTPMALAGQRGHAR
ncbi:hypothetical protein FB45DRAFT_885529 [Roridomyces roridus]|uniref:Ankyrin repeat protein n=1 Tax=Roridomyces roridus TaxID=1738132 RepID=A0AAD7CI33_9AGAR|nr:hypothetical protein FB45DRAFT_885529 [Roridomyces roridus]